MLLSLSRPRRLEATRWDEGIVGPVMPIGHVETAPYGCAIVEPAAIRGMKRNEGIRQTYDSNAQAFFM
jgi:hypothetical protein